MNNSKILILGSLSLLAMAACKKNELDLVGTNPPPQNSAYLKVVHASAYTVNYVVNLKLNDGRVSNNISYSTPFPGGGLNTGGSTQPWYLAVNSGSTKLGLVAVRAAATTVDSATLYTNTVNLESGKYYSAFLSDTAANTQTLLVNDNVTPEPLGKSRFKFVNLIPNVPALDLYVGTSVVAANVPYKGVSAEFRLNTSDTVRFYLRPAGTAATTTPTSTYPTLSPFAAPFAVPNGRVLTVYSRGYSGATANRLPNISLFYNN